MMNEDVGEAKNDDDGEEKDDDDDDDDRIVGRRPRSLCLPLALALLTVTMEKSVIPLTDTFILNSIS
jgi:hypothetical protein